MLSTVWKQHTRIVSVQYNVQKNSLLNKFLWKSRKIHTYFFFWATSYDYVNETMFIYVCLHAWVSVYGCFQD